MPSGQPEPPHTSDIRPSWQQCNLKLEHSDNNRALSCRTSTQYTIGDYTVIITVGNTKLRKTESINNIIKN